MYDYFSVACADQISGRSILSKNTHKKLPVKIVLANLEPL